MHRVYVLHEQGQVYIQGGGARVRLLWPHVPYSLAKSCAAVGRGDLAEIRGDWEAQLDLLPTDDPVATWDEHFGLRFPGVPDVMHELVGVATEVETGYMNVTEAAELFGVHEMTMARWAKAKGFPETRFTAGNRRHWLRVDLERWASHAFRTTQALLPWAEAQGLILTPDEVARKMVELKAKIENDPFKELYR